jgi:hypothetical protein
MEGVILYADDHIHSTERMENALFKELRQDLPVLGVDSLELASAAVRSIGSFGAVILDWQFTPDKVAFGDDIAEEAKEAGIAIKVQIPSLKEDATLKFLMEHDFYSLIYIFSEKDIAETHGQQLTEKYGDRIRIKKKSDFSQLGASEIKQAILKEIAEWKEVNKNLSVPIKWGTAINSSMQSIFKDLADADKDWIKELYNSGKDDGVAPEVFLIELLQLLLMEELVQNQTLIESLKAEGEGQKASAPEENVKKKSLSKLFSRLYYSKLTEKAPVMTGDIFELSDSQYGILITPECDLWKIKADKNLSFDLLAFSKTSMNEAFKIDSVKSQKKSIFNPVLTSWHFLPSLPVLSAEFNNGCAIDFSTGAIKIKSEDLLKLPKEYKLNSPFIQSLRQRYLSHLGRVGTPRVHEMVTKFHLENYFPATPSTAPAATNDNNKKP